MKKQKLMGLCMLVYLAGLTGCNKQIPEQKEAVVQETENPDDSSMYNTGQGFHAPKDSHIDKKGNIVDAEGNTFNTKGEWQIPEGGRVDSKGRILDKDGNVMGGGATVGSVG